MYATNHAAAFPSAHAALARGIASNLLVPHAPSRRRHRPAQQAHADRAREERPRPDTRFRPGNRAWAARRSSGRRRKFADERALWNACVGYFEHVEANPLIHVEPVVWRGKVTMLLEVPRLRPFTLTGLCAHLGIGTQTWRDYRRRAAFSWVCEQVEDAIHAQQYEGVAAGLFDPRIVWRWLALDARADGAERAGS